MRLTKSDHEELRARSKPNREASLAAPTGSAGSCELGKECPYLRDLLKCREERDEILDALRGINAHYDDLRKSNPGFMGKLTLQNYALWNEALLKSEKVLSRYPQNND